MSINRRSLLILAVLLLGLAQMSTAAQFAVVSESFNVNPGGTLTVDVSSADVVISGVSQNIVTVNAKGLREEYREFLEISQTPEGVLVKFNPHGMRGTRNESLVFEIGLPNEFNIDIETAGGDITVSAELRGNADVETAGGDITFEGRLTGNLKGRTSGGDVEVDDITGTLEVSTSGGDIDVGNVSGNAEVSTSGGDIEIKMVQGNLNAETSGGDISVDQVTGDASLETAGGDLEIGSVGGNLEAETAGGDISAESVGGTTKAETAGGDLRMEKLGGNFKAATVGGDVMVSLAGSYGGEMDTIGGDLVLMLPASAQVSIKAEIKLGEEDSDRISPITSEFGTIELKRKAFLKSVSSSFDINGGGPLIELSNLNGSIAVKKLP